MFLLLTNVEDHSNHRVNKVSKSVVFYQIYLF